MMNALRSNTLPVFAMFMVSAGLVASCATGADEEALGLGAGGMGMAGEGGSGGGAGQDAGGSGDGSGGTSGAAGSMGGAAGQDAASGGQAGEGGEAGGGGEAGSGGEAGEGGSAGAGGTGGGGTGGGGTGGGGTGGGGTGGGGTGGGGTGGGGTGGGGTGGTGGSVDAGVCPGITVGATCVFLPSKASMEEQAALTSCTGLGAGWGLCDPAVLCDSATFGYLAVGGCDCNGGAASCACGSSTNLYVHVAGPYTPYYIRTSLVPNCDWADDACTDSVSETCGIALCCR